MKLDPCLLPHKKINSKWIKDFNLRIEAIKTHFKNRGKLYNTGFLKCDTKNTGNKENT